MRMWFLFVFSLFLQGLDSRSNPFQEGKDDTSQMATLIFEDMIGGHHLKAQDLVTPRAQEYEGRPILSTNKAVCGRLLGASKT